MRFYVRKTCSLLIFSIYCGENRIRFFLKSFESSSLASRREQQSPEDLPRSFEPVHPAERTGFAFASKALNPFLLLRGENDKAPRVYLGALNLFILRREQDSNLRTGFAGYTLSRRASSTTRAPLLILTLKTTAKVQK